MDNVAFVHDAISINTYLSCIIFSSRSMALCLEFDCFATKERDTVFRKSSDRLQKWVKFLRGQLFDCVSTFVQRLRELILSAVLTTNW